MAYCVFRCCTMACSLFFFLFLCSFSLWFVIYSISSGFGVCMLQVLELCFIFMNEFHKNFGFSDLEEISFQLHTTTWLKDERNVNDVLFSEFTLCSNSLQLFLAPQHKRWTKEEKKNTFRLFDKSMHPNLCGFPLDLFVISNSKLFTENTQYNS